LRALHDGDESLAVAPKRCAVSVNNEELVGIPDLQPVWAIAKASSAGGPESGGMGVSEDQVSVILDGQSVGGHSFSSSAGGPQNIAACRKHDVTIALHDQLYFVGGGYDGGG